MARKILVIAVAILLVFWLVTDPQGAGSTVHAVVSRVQASFGQFVKGL